MELKEHLKLAFQTEVQLYVTETQVLPEWQKAESIAINIKATDDDDLEEAIQEANKTSIPSGLKPIKTPEQIEAEVRSFKDKLYNARMACLEDRKLKMWNKNALKAKDWDEKYKKCEQNKDTSGMRKYNRTPNKEDAEFALRNEKDHKFTFGTLLGEIFSNIMLCLKLEIIVLIILFAAYFITKSQYKALVIIPFVLIGIAVLFSIAIGVSNFKDGKANNRLTIAEYEKYISKYDEQYSKYLKEKQQLVLECEKEYKKRLEKAMEEREEYLEERQQLIINFKNEKDQRLNALKERNAQFDAMVKYTSGMRAYIEESIKNMKLVLHTFYEAGFDGGKIHERYRGLIPVGMFYEYVDTERCDCLTGHGGAYNMYEDDCRAARVEQKLDKINDNMFYIGKEIKSAIGSVGYAVMGATNLMSNKIDAQNLDLQRDISRLRSENSHMNGMLESLKRDGISVHGTIELKNW